MRRIPRSLLLLLLGLGATGPAVGASASPAQADAATGLRQAVERGREAREAGRFEEAAAHFLYALSRSDRPRDVREQLLANALAAAQADAPGGVDALFLWTADLLRSEVDDGGQASLPRDLRDALDEDGPLGALANWPVRLATARAAALDEVLDAIDRRDRARGPEAAVEREWLEDLARALARPSAGLRAAVEDCAPTVRNERSTWNDVLDELRRLGNSLLSSGQWSEAIRAGRILGGMVAQAGFGDELRGPEPPSLTSEAAAAGEILSRARAALARKPGLEYTLDELEAMGADERRALTVDRASFGLPSVTESPRGWYRVETSCGWETLYGTATTVEYHHTRLANFFGRDPFEGRQGTVRVVPEAYGLEAEGAPYWWVGGFQGGDITTVQFTIGTIPGLGRLLTHELTHRFDGAIYPGLPGWLVEGKATWTGGAYGSMEETGFVPNHCSYGTMTGTIGLGYHREDKLRELVDGSLEEYRDNYTAGYALYVYLNTWTGAEEVDGEDFGPEGAYPAPAEGQRAPLYHDALQRFMEERKRLRNDPIDVFEHYFCDGEQGRPADFAEFSERFSLFLHGFNNQEPAHWRDRYTQEVPGSDPGGVVRDEPTWTWLRRRAEPWFGQEHARMAGDLFLEQGKHSEAVRAYTWALAVDELAPATVEDFATALRGDGADDAAWMVLHWPRLQPAGARVPLRTWEEGAPGAAEAARLPAPGDTPAPFARELQEVGAFLDLFAEAAAACEEAGWGLSAHAVAADHNLIAPWLGRPPLEEPRRTRARIVEDGIDRGWAPAWSDAQWTTGADALHPFDSAWRPLGASGWTEFDLTGHEDRRVRELWYQDATNALWVGRDEAAIGTGEMERHSPHRNAVVFAEEWFDPGRYAITMQIEPATAFVEGGLVFGWTRRDRNVRLSLSMRDHEYARGESEEYRLGGVGWSLDALYARRGAQDGAQGLPDGRDFFELTIEVDGPTADVFLDGKPQGSISTLDASAIHGRVGFWVTQGVMKVSQPRVRRLDRSAARPGARAVGNGLHPRRRGDERWRWLVGRPVSGLPLAPSGTVVLWYPEQTEDKLGELKEGAWYDEVAEELNRLLDGMELEFPSQGVLVLLPESFPEADVVALREGFGEYVRGGFDVVRHDRPEAAEEELRTIAGWRRPLIAFVDPTGFLRYARREGRPTTRLPQPLRELLVEHQDHSRPGRAGAGD